MKSKIKELFKSDEKSKFIVRYLTHKNERFEDVVLFDEIDDLETQLDLMGWQLIMIKMVMNSENKGV